MKKNDAMARLISFVWPERKPWITDAWYIAWPADAIFALVPMATTASLCASHWF
jgi:hypothetical protein